jgi:hypothetical protein
MDVLLIQGFVGKLQPHEKIVNKIQEDIGAKIFFFQRKMILDIPKGVKDVDKIEKEEQETNLIGEAVAVLTGQLVSHIK